MKDVLSFFLDWKVKLAAFIFFCILAFSWHTTAVHNAVSVAKVETKVELQEYYNKKIDALQKDSDRTQKELKDNFNTQIKEKDAKHEALNTKYSNLLNSLSNRPERPSSIYGLSLPPRNAESPIYVDGRGLYRTDANFLARYSARTERLKTELQSCYSQYETARQTLEDFKKAHQQP